MRGPYIFMFTYDVKFYKVVSVLHILAKMIFSHYCLVDLNQLAQYHHSSLYQGSTDQSGPTPIWTIWDRFGWVLDRPSSGPGTPYLSLFSKIFEKIENHQFPIVFLNFRGFRVLIEQCEYFELAFFGELIEMSHSKYESFF